jgi:hypothetical protein
MDDHPATPMVGNEEDAMRAVRRAGEPSVVNRVSDDVYQVAVTLDSSPSPAWLSFFRSTEDPTRYPMFIDVTGSALLFESHEQPPGWLADLDRWIQIANRACAEMFV